MGLIERMIAMLFGGARTRPFEVADRVDFFDQFGGFAERGERFRQLAEAE